MITFTDTGAEKVKEFLSSQNADVTTSGLRVGVRGGGCSGFQYALAFDTERDGDQVFESQGLRPLGGGARPPPGRRRARRPRRARRRAGGREPGPARAGRRSQPALRAGGDERLRREPAGGRLQG